MVMDGVHGALPPGHGQQGWEPPSAPVCPPSGHTCPGLVRVPEVTFLAATVEKAVVLTGADSVISRLFPVPRAGGVMDTLPVGGGG